MVVGNAGLKVIFSLFTYLAFPGIGDILWVNSIAATLFVIFRINTTSIGTSETRCSDNGFFRYAGSYIPSRYYDTTGKKEQANDYESCKRFYGSQVNLHQAHLLKCFKFGSLK